MARLLVRGFTISLDGYGAGPHQSLEHPLGVGAESLHAWLVSTRTFQRMVGGEGGDTGIDEDFAAQSMSGNGAWILGRNMFGPIRGPWPIRIYATIQNFVVEKAAVLYRGVPASQRESSV